MPASPPHILYGQRHPYQLEMEGDNEIHKSWDVGNIKDTINRPVRWSNMAWNPNGRASSPWQMSKRGKGPRMSEHLSIIMGQNKKRGRPPRSYLMITAFI